MLLLLAMFSVSTSPIIARYLETVPAVAISFWRMGFGAFILWLISIFKKQVVLENENFKRTIIAGFFLGIHFALFFGSLKLTTIANATFLGTLAPVITFILEKYILKRKQPTILVWGLILAVIGTIIIVSNKFDFSSDYTIGNLLAISCSIFLGFAFIISENVRKKVGTVSYSRTLFTVAAITLFIIALITKVNLFGYTSYQYFGLLLLGIIPTLLGHGSMYYAIRYVSPTIVASIPMGEPIIASILAWILFQEKVGVVIIFGGSITLLGLILLVQKNNN
tara:strand:+ start:12 stop:851 length:840 start_codon:yes stop_codon:yes gene_type:complete